MSVEVSEGITVKRHGAQNIILSFKDSEEGPDHDPFMWGFPTLNDFGLFVAALQGFYNEVAR